MERPTESKQGGPASRSRSPTTKVDIDHGEAERQLRNPVVGRKKDQGTRSERGARVASLMFILVQTCTLLGVDPFDDLLEAVTRARRRPGTVHLPHKHRTESAQARGQA